MKIAFNQRPYDGPWGGGNRFLLAITSELERAGHDVQFDLIGDLDIILMVDPRTRSPNVTFGAGAILRYLVCHPNTVVIHRINECDERKGYKFITAKLLRANYCADLTAFVGSWLMDLPAWKNYDRTRAVTLLNGADTAIFNANGFTPWSGAGPVKFVTHHWGAHRFKGFDVYEYLDDQLNDPAFSARVAFTYVGNLPKGLRFKNITMIDPLNGAELADELRKHHAYLTASINEPGGNHQNEGALCGLPLVYRNSGCLPEYCEGFGVSFNGVQDVKIAIDHLINDYAGWVTKMPSYPRTIQNMANDWLAFFDEALARRNDIVAARNLWRNPYLFFCNQFPI
jgi:hypothetical protein